MMNYQQDQGDSFLYYSIIERIFSNIFFETETFFDKSDLIKHALYETKLCECIDLFDKNFLSKEENINSKVVHFLYQLQKISLCIKSCGAFLKILKLMKSKNIAFNNYSSIYEENLKFDISNLTKKRIKENIIDHSKIFEISLYNEDVSGFEFCLDDMNLFLSYKNNDKNYIKIVKYCLLTGNIIIEKEIDNDLSISLLNDYKNNKLNALVYKEKNEFELLIINKINLSIEKKILINSPIEKEEFTQIVTSLSFFYLISHKRIYCLDLSNLNKTLIFNELYTKSSLPIDKAYYFFLDDYIIFSNSNKIDLIKKTIDNAYEENDRYNERNYFDNFNNIFYSLIYIKGRKTIEMYKCTFNNFKLRMINSNKEINKIKENKDNSLSILQKNYPINTFDKSKDNNYENITDPFKYYLDYSNNLESILNNNDNTQINKKTEYKIDKELSENYYLYLYSSMIYYFYYLDGKNNNNRIIINVNSDIIFDIIKQIAIEEKDYCLLYTFVYFITLETDINSKFDEKINWIVNFCLSQEKFSSYLFEILREIYKYNPKYINSTNITKDIIFSKKLTFEERISYFSLISLKDKKDIFNKLLETFLSMEKQIILANGENIRYSKLLYNEVSENFINYFQDINIYKFDEKGYWEEFTQILKIFINSFNSIIEEINKNENKNNLILSIKNSVVSKVLFLLINIIILKNDKIAEK